MSSSRDTSRDIRRLASLYNGVAFEQLRALCWNVHLDDKLRDDGILEIWAQACQKPIEQTPLFGESVPDDMRRTFVSINKCVAVIVYNTAWLAYCIEGLDTSINEMTLTEPKRVHEVELWYPPGKQCSTNYFHTILLFTPQSGEEPIVADASYAQYSFDQGIDTFDKYLREKMQEGSIIYKDNFGEEFEKNEKNKGLDIWILSKTASIVRTTNNVVVRELVYVGGVEALLEYSSRRFEEAQNTIFAAVKREMEELRLRLEEMEYGGHLTDLESLKDFVESFDGAGHQSCMQSFERERERMTVQVS